MAQALARFGKYELVARLAKGGMAETYRAQLRGAAGVTKAVVIKKVLPHFAQDEAFIEAFINEAKVSASLSHGNIAQVFDFGRVEGDYFIAMELVDGRSLAQVLERAQQEGLACLPVPIACFIAIEVLKGLHYAHTRVGPDGVPLNIVHRDVSPENILIAFEGHPKVVDFGVAKAALRGRKETEPGMVKGKFLYFSPEQALAADLDCRSDVYAVGIVLYRMLCGVLPFEGQMHGVMHDIVNGRFRPATAVNPSLPQALAAVLARAMATKREDRFATALQMQEALAGFLYRQEPTFSEEAVKDCMGWLFDREVSGRFYTQLARWQTHTRAVSTSPSVRALKPVATAAAPKANRTPAVAFIGGGLAFLGAAALVAFGAGLGEGEAPRGPPAPAPIVRGPPAPTPAAAPRPAPSPDVATFPAIAVVSATRHRLKLEEVSLPEFKPAEAGFRGRVSELGPPTHAPVFAVSRAPEAAADGQVAVVLRTGAPGLPPFTTLKVFDFQPFLQSLSGELRRLDLGAEARTFTDTAAQIDGRSGAWMTVRQVTGRVRLTLTPLNAAVWAGRPRRASVVVAWQRAPDAVPYDDADWPGGVTRAVLTEGTPLVVEGATTFAFAFADSFATAEGDSVSVLVEAAADAPLTVRPPQPAAAADHAPPRTPQTIEQTLAENRDKLLPCFTVLEWAGQGTYVLAKFQVEMAVVTQLTIDPPKQRTPRLTKCVLTELRSWAFPFVKGPAKTLSVRYEVAAQNFVGGEGAQALPHPEEDLRLVQAMIAGSQYGRAQELLRSCLRVNPDNAECHRALGAVEARLHNTPAAIQHYQAFVRLAPEHHPDLENARAILKAYADRAKQ